MPPLTQPSLGFDDIQCGAFLTAYGANAPYEDFMEGDPANTQFASYWNKNNNGLGATTFPNITPLGHPGNARLSTGTGVGSDVSVATVSYSAPSFPLANGFWEVAWYFNISQLSGTGDNFILRAGLGTSQVVEPSNGCYVEYDQSQSLNWRGVTANGGARSKVSGNVPVIAGSYVQVSINGADSLSANFFVNNVEAGIGGISTNLPLGAVVVPFVQLTKTLGTAVSILVDLDCAFFRCAFTGNR